MLLSIEMTLQYLIRKCFYLCLTCLINFIRVDIAYLGFIFIAHHKDCEGRCSRILVLFCLTPS